MDLRHSLPYMIITGDALLLCSYFLRFTVWMFHFCQSVMVNGGMYCYNNVLVFVYDATIDTFKLLTVYAPFRCTF